MSKPMRPGLYWAKVGKTKTWNSVVVVDGVFPFLRIAKAVFVPNGLTVDAVPLDSIEWGPQILDPEEAMGVIIDQANLPPEEKTVVVKIER
jgi:hypothetical protein